MHAWGERGREGGGGKKPAHARQQREPTETVQGKENGKMRNCTSEHSLKKKKYKAV